MMGCDAHHGSEPSLVLNVASTLRRSWDMSYHEYPRLRLEIDHEAKALMLNLGAEAYSAARQRAAEASSAEMAKGWSGVAAAIGRRTAKRRPLLSYLLH
jgi:hypothetical protein